MWAFDIYVQVRAEFTISSLHSYSYLHTPSLGFSAPYGRKGEGPVVSVWITRSHHSILYLPPKEVSLPGFVQVAARSGSHRVRDRISAEKDTKESVKLKGQKNIVRVEA